MGAMASCPSYRPDATVRSVGSNATRADLGPSVSSVTRKPCVTYGGLVTGDAPDGPSRGADATGRRVGS